MLIFYKRKLFQITLENFYFFRKKLIRDFLKIKMFYKEFFYNLKKYNKIILFCSLFKYILINCKNSQKGLFLNFLFDIMKIFSNKFFFSNILKSLKIRIFKTIH